jgi:hypothetical protein
MIYAFQITYEKDLDDILKLMKDAQEGIFILPEGFLDSKSGRVNDLREITKNGRASIITGVKNGNNSPYKAHVFAYGEQEPVYHENEIFFLPDGDNKVRTNIRVGTEIMKPYSHQDFEFLAAVSSLSLDGLMNSNFNGESAYEKLRQMLGPKPKVVALATSSYSKAEIFETTGNSAGILKLIMFEDSNNPFQYVSYEMNKSGLAAK